MNKPLWILIAFVCGAVLPIQAALNTRLGRAIESPVYASMISFIVGLIGIILYAMITRQTMSLTASFFGTIPSW